MQWFNLYPIMEINILIDDFTESITNVITGEIFKTVVLPVRMEEIAKLKWNFDWAVEVNSGHEYIN